MPSLRTGGMLPHAFFCAALATLAAVCIGGVPLPDGRVQRMTEVEVPFRGSGTRVRPTQTDSGFTVRRLADGVYGIIRNEPLGLVNESNSVVIVGERDVIVVDAQSSTQRTLQTLRAVRSLTSKPVSTVVNTHWHDDHVIGNHVYRDTFPGVTIVGHPANTEDMATLGVQFRRASVRASRGTAAYLRGLAERGESFIGGPADGEERRSHTLAAWLVDEYSDADSTLLPLPPTRTVSDRLELRQGRRVIEVIHPGRGHTRGDLVVHLPRDRLLIAGDLVMWPVQFVGSTSFPGEYAATIDRLRGLHAATVVPGHGPVLDGPRADAHMSLVADMLRFISLETRAAVQRGDSLAQARRAIDLTRYEQAMAGVSQLRRGLFDYYVRKSAIARGYEEAAAER